MVHIGRCEIGLSHPVKVFFTDHSVAVRLFRSFVFLCLVLLMLLGLFIAGLWSPAGKGLTSSLFFWRC